MGELQKAFLRRWRTGSSRLVIALLFAGFPAGKALAQAAANPNESGLDFPSNGQTSADIRFRFTGANLIPMYPATYIWRVKVRHQSGYYTTFFWGPDGPFTGDSFYGCHPYPDGGGAQTQTHKWEVSINGGDFVNDANSHSTQLGYDVWRTQAFRAVDDGREKVHEFYWDLPDTTKVIRVKLDRSYGVVPPLNPALTFGDAPWSLGRERLSGILRGIQIYSAHLSLPDVAKEIGAPLSTSAGTGSIWYLNLNPTPQDIADKSGKSHHPAWVGSVKASAWSATASMLAGPFPRVAEGRAAARIVRLRRDAAPEDPAAVLDGLGRPDRGGASGVRFLPVR